MHFMTNSGAIIKAADDLYFAAPAVNALIRKLKEYADHTNDRSIDVAKFKEIAGVSRKYAIPLLEYLDRQKVTIRTGDRRSIS